MAAKTKVKSEKGVEKVPKSPAKKPAASPVKSPKAKKDAVKKVPMKKKPADAAKEAKHPAASKMVAEAFATLKHRGKGNSLFAIRNFVEKHFAVKVDKRMNYNIKKYIGDEFSAGRIKMVGDDGDEIKYNQRFALVK